jgi:hypothetical protein
LMPLRTSASLRNSSRSISSSCRVELHSPSHVTHESIIKQWLEIQLTRPFHAWQKRPFLTGLERDLATAGHLHRFPPLPPPLWLLPATCLARRLFPSCIS